ncbi:putative transposase [Herbaspirillum sp. Sphag1AN]|uniref:transposase n=1 Tax=unclassified Herbaspirillum TaxID=2624150 RepID=UPI001614B8E3|nr:MULTISPECIES: transposase [unclassified Herbaspirillum]MBB3214634.1 putative transposase [Herbaspirillum sp. Sphag1AN]MBB3247830.1 putative transposase [Herbaspirillum sp. Sphag64]
MARLPRLVVPFQAHHVIQRGHHQQLIFRDAADHIAFLDWLKEGAKRFKVALHAYVLMPDHVHLLATPSDAEGLARMMQWLGRYYVPYFNQKYDRAGTLWQGRYKATVVDAETYLLLCSRYIELNPVRSGLVAAPTDYQWSSYVHHIGARQDPLITDHQVYWDLGNTPFDREIAYKKLVEQPLSANEMTAITQATLKGWALGGAQFMQMLEKQANRRVSPAKRGRPAKKVKVDEEKEASSYLV